MKEPRNMAAIQSQLEMSRGLWAGRKPSSNRNTTSETEGGKEQTSRRVSQSWGLQRGETDKQDRQTDRQDRQTERQKETNGKTNTQTDT